jgi:tartrate-resistant acid phosphatase type 5
MHAFLHAFEIRFSYISRMNAILRYHLFAAMLAALLASPLVAQKSVIENARAVEPFDASQRLPAPRLAFLIFGDQGTGGKGQKRVAESMARKLKADGADAVLGTGDNFYGSGVASPDELEWDTKFEHMYPPEDFPIPFCMTLGNHDYGLNPDAQVAYTGKLLPDGSVTRWQMPSRSWTRVFAAPDGSFSIRVIGLETEAIIGMDAVARKREMAWLDSLLAASRETWVLVCGHHPVFSNGVHGNIIGMMRNVKPIFELRKVDAYFAGHDHDLQVLAPVNGVRYFISGGGSLSRDVRYEDNTAFAATNMGFMWVQVNADAMLVQVLDADGNVVFARSVPRRTDR